MYEQIIAYNNFMQVALPANDLQAVGSVGELIGELLLGSMDSRDTHAAAVEVSAERSLYRNLATVIL